MSVDLSALISAYDRKGSYHPYLLERGNSVLEKRRHNTVVIKPYSYISTICLVSESKCVGPIEIANLPGALAL
jgi:hypothetical protein